MKSRTFEDYYLHQAGSGLPLFVGARYQSGHGLGSFLAGLARAAVPVLKRGGQALLKQGLKSGVDVLGDVLEGQNVKTALKRRAKQAGQSLLTSASHALIAPPGQPAAKRIKRKPGTRSRQSASRRRGGDIFS